MGKQFVLVHGASHGAWCWDTVARQLLAGGHTVVAMDLPGHGRRAGEYAKAGIVNYAEAVAEAMALAGISRGIVVGHSMAGVVISKVAELTPERVAHLVYLAAVVLPDGQSFFSAHLSPAAQAMIRGLAQASRNLTFRFPAEMAWARWMNDIPRTHPAAEEAFARLTPQPLRPLVERVDLKRFYAMPLPRTYIRCLKDVAVTPEKALEYAERLGVRPVDLDAAHDAMLSAPEPLVRLLERI
jgi:pimeloyl-ACP methyl ester carboxylesterase